MIELPALSLTGVASYQQTERGIADRAGDDHKVACPGPAATHHPAVRQRPECHYGYGHRTGRANRIATQQGAAIGVRIGAQATREGFEPFLADGFREREREEKTRRCRSLGGKIGEVHAQRFLGDRVRGVIDKEMHAADERVGREHQIGTRGRRECRCIVDEPARARMGG